MMDPMEGVQRMYDHSDNLGLNGFPKFYDECNTAAPDFQFFKVFGRLRNYSPFDQ